MICLHYYNVFGSKFKMVNRRRPRRPNPRSSLSNRGQVVRVPFKWTTPATQAAQSKQMTAGDLGLDISRPLRLLSLRYEYIGVTAWDSTFIVTLIADGQEGTVSMPHIVSPVVRRGYLRQRRIMDYGLYGTGGSLAVFILTGTQFSAVSFTVTGHAVVEYLNSSTLHIVKGSEPYRGSLLREDQQEPLFHPA